jgi:hypothetical protein
MRVPLKIKGKAAILDSSKPHEITLQFFGYKRSKKEKLVIFDTDYENYALVHKCLVKLKVKKELVLVLSRYKSLDPETLDMLLEKLGTLGVELKRLNYIDQIGC